MKSLVKVLAFLVLLMVAGIALYLTQTRAGRIDESRTALPPGTPLPPVRPQSTNSLSSSNVLTAAEPAPLPITELRLRLESYENGDVKTELSAEFAEVPDEGAIEAQQVRAQMYDTNGHVTAALEAEACIYDREQKRAFSDSRVKLEQDQVTITGRGFEWRMEDQTVRILHDVRVVSKRSLNSRWEFGK